MTTTIYHGGQKPAKRGRLWCVEDVSYAREYARTKGGKVYATCLDLSRMSVLDLRSAGLDAARAARMIAREAGIEAPSCDDWDTHCVVREISDEQWRAAGVDAIRIIEETDGVQAETICLIR